MMSKAKNAPDGAPEIDAMRDVYAALKDLDVAAQARVIRYAAEMLGISLSPNKSGERNTEEPAAQLSPASPASNLPETPHSDDLDGVSSVAVKWMKRSGLTSKSLQKLFSLGIDEIDLVADDVPGKSKRERMRNVLLLKGIAAYLGTGAARVTNEQLKEACLHYKAYDATNFATHLKAISADVGGSKESGYTLTPRGLSAATELVKNLTVDK